MLFADTCSERMTQAVGFPRCSGVANVGSTGLVFFFFPLLLRLMCIAVFLHFILTDKDLFPIYKTEMS